MDYQNTKKSLASHVVAVLAVTPKGIPLVRDPKKPEPKYWKLPGGHGIGSESVEKSAVRELKEETGIILKPEDLWVSYEEERNEHTFVLVQGTALSLAGFKGTGDEGEEVKLFLPEEIKKLVDFFPAHKEILEEIKFF